jgi:hypothetical protein
MNRHGAPPAGGSENMQCIVLVDLWSLSTSFKKSWEREGCIAFVRFVDDMFFCVAMMQQ